MISPSQSKPEVTDTRPDDLDELIKTQLEQSRAQWMRDRERYRTIRSLSFVFLFIVIMGALLAFFYVLTRLPH